MQKVNFHKSKLVGKLEGFEAYGTNTITNKFCFDRYTQAVIKNKKALKGYRKKNPNRIR